MKKRIDDDSIFNPLNSMLDITYPATANIEDTHNPDNPIYDLVDKNGDDLEPPKDSQQNDTDQETSSLTEETNTTPAKPATTVKEKMSSNQLVTCMQQQVNVCEGIIALIEKYETHKITTQDTTLPDLPEEIKQGLTEHTAKYKSWCKTTEIIAKYFAKIETPIPTKKTTTTAKTTTPKTPEKPKEEQFSFDFN
ncbi:MAG: hypothetical protein WC725_05150 [Patescibacteria group bacterium]|jgi:hypothetical protein